MNYAAHYDRLISRARTRVLLGYRERHHVLPRCMGGSDAPANIVALTAEEHCVAHLLLVKIYPGHIGIVRAATMMSKKGASNKTFGWLRRRNSSALLGHTFNAGKKHSPETRAKMSVAKRGKPKSSAHIAKLSARALGRKHSIESRLKMREANLGKRHSPETRAKMSVSQTGRVVSKETRAKISYRSRGNTYALGKPVSPETRAKLAAANTGRKHSPEWIQNWRASMQSYWQKKSAEHIGA